MDKSVDFAELIRHRIETSIEVKRGLLPQGASLAQAAGKLIQAYKAGKKVLLFGNGGSAADAQHIAAELVGKYYMNRKPLPAVALTVNTSSVTAIGNDYSFDQIFARQIEALGSSGDVAIGISTSGNSPNVIKGVQAAKRKALVTVGLTGDDGGCLKGEVDYCICVPSKDTPRVQEAHILIGHILCEIVELALFKRDDMPCLPMGDKLTFGISTTGNLPNILNAMNAGKGMDGSTRNKSWAQLDAVTKKKPAIFLDRDGVINRNSPDYVKSWAEFDFLPDVLEALRQMADAPYPIIIVTNQSAIGRGMVARDVVDKIHIYMTQAICEAGGRVDAIYYCPHTPEDGCDCRKPRPGLLLRAAKELNVDLKASYLIDDNLRDLDAALAVGAHPVLVRTGHGSTVSPQLISDRVMVFDDLSHVVDTQLARFWGVAKKHPGVQKL